MTASTLLVMRFGELEASLRALRRLEKQQLRNKRPSSDVAELIAASRASVYVILYNSIESAVRAILRSIREEILMQGLNFQQVHKFWRLDALQASFLKRMQDGTNHGNLLLEVSAYCSGPVSWEGESLARMPAGGNFGQKAALRLKESLDIAWTVPSRTLGGDDLENVRERRNALAHGLETFKEAGNKVTASDLEEMLGRVKLFMVSYIEALERYRDTKNYVI